MRWKIYYKASVRYVCTPRDGEGETLGNIPDSLFPDLPDLSLAVMHKGTGPVPGSGLSRYCGCFVFARQR